MNTHKKFKQQSLVGVKNKNDGSIVIPAIYKTIEIYLDRYFDCESENGRVVLNTKNKVLFGFENPQKFNQILVDGKLYTIITVEENEVENILSYYGKICTGTVMEHKVYCKISIDGNKVKKQYLKESEMDEILHPF